MRVGIAFFLAVAGFLLAGVPMFIHPPTPYIGANISGTTTHGLLRVVAVDARSPAARAGIRSGDEIGCLSFRDRRLFSPDIYRGLDYGIVAGRPVDLCTVRSSTTRSIALVPDLRPPARGLYGSAAGAAFRLAEFAVFLVCGVLFVYGRRGAISWLFLLYALGTAPNATGYINLTVLPNSWYTLYSVGLAAFDFAAPGFLLIFTLLVPDDRAPGWRWPALITAASLTSLSLLYNAIAPLRFEINAESFSPRLPEAVLAGLCIVAVMVRLATMPPELRTRFRWAGFSIVWGVVTIAIAHRTFPLGDEAGIIAALLSVLMPISMLYAVLREHIIDLRFVLSRTIVFTVITTLIVAVIGIVDWLTAQYLHGTRVATIVDAAVTIGLAIALHRIYAWIETAIDFLLFRKKYEAEAYLHRVARSLLAADETPTIDHELVDTPYSTLDLTFAILYRVSDAGYEPCELRGLTVAPTIEHDGELVRFIKTEHKAVHFNELRTCPEGLGSSALAIGIPRGRTLAGFAVYGYHRGGSAIDPDEIEALERLCDAAGRAYVNIELARYAHVPIEIAYST